MKEISAGIYNFLCVHTTILNDAKPGWHFIDLRSLLSAVPALKEYFQDLKLIPRHSAVTMVFDNKSLPVHSDEPPVIAKINMPVINTKGWINLWWDHDKIVDKLADMDCPIVFNSQIPHSVEREESAQAPRIVASFTFFNEPLELLE